MEEAYKTLPRHTCSWLKGRFTLVKFQGFWNIPELQDYWNIRENYKLHPSDVILCSFPKSGATWLKALAFSIVTREKFDQSANPLLKNVPHDCIPFLEKDLERIKENQKTLDFPLIATHLPYSFLPESVIASNCKIVYIYRNIKDVMVSFYEFLREISKLSVEYAPFEEAFDEYCQGIIGYGPYWDHILEYWKASQERPDKFLFLKYEDMKRDPTSNVKRLAEFIGYPFANEEEKGGMVGNIINFCGFENLKNLEVNKIGKHRPHDVYAIENRLFFRKAKDGDWENYFTDEMIKKIDGVIDQKLSGTGLVLK